MEDGGEEAVEAEGLRASLGDDDLIASEDVDIVGVEEMVASEEPEEVRPRDGSGEEALHGAVAGAVAAPAGDAGHGDAAGHGQERESDAAEVTEVTEGGRQGWRQLSSARISMGFGCPQVVGFATTTLLPKPLYFTPSLA